MNNGIELAGLGYRKEGPGEQPRVAIVAAAAAEVVMVVDKQVAAAETVA